MYVCLRYRNLILSLVFLCHHGFASTAFNRARHVLATLGHTTTVQITAASPSQSLTAVRAGTLVGVAGIPYGFEGDTYKFGHRKHYFWGKRGSLVGLDEALPYLVASSVTRYVRTYRQAFEILSAIPETNPNLLVNVPGGDKFIHNILRVGNPTLPPWDDSWEQAAKFADMLRGAFGKAPDPFYEAHIDDFHDFLADVSTHPQVWRGLERPFADPNEEIVARDVDGYLNNLPPAEWSRPTALLRIYYRYAQAVLAAARIEIPGAEHPIAVAGEYLDLPDESNRLRLESTVLRGWRNEFIAERSAGIIAAAHEQNEDVLLVVDPEDVDPVRQRLTEQLAFANLTIQASVSTGPDCMNLFRQINGS